MLVVMRLLESLASSIWGAGRLEARRGVGEDHGGGRAGGAWLDQERVGQVQSLKGKEGSRKGH